MNSSSTPFAGPLADEFDEPLIDRDELREQAQQAAAELMDNAGEYVDLIRAIREKRPTAEIVKELGEVMVEGSEDLKVLLPAIMNTQRALRDGVDTSEYKMYSWVNRILTIVALLAPVIEGCLAAWQTAHGQDSSFGGSMIVTGLSVFLKTVIADRYNKGRVLIKQQAARSPFEVEEIRG
jgi:hypothetical protein